MIGRIYGKNRQNLKHTGQTLSEKVEAEVNLGDDEAKMMKAITTGKFPLYNFDWYRVQHTKPFFNSSKSRLVGPCE
ncbi:4071_t:CDS:2 [Entrophospora sp. SA101]|nr:4071_t:CDS:2 [Entrophospora sp. SA101]